MKPTRLFDLPNYQLDNASQPGMFVTKVNGQWDKISTSEFVGLVKRIFQCTDWDGRDER